MKNLFYLEKPGRTEATRVGNSETLIPTIGTNAPVLRVASGDVLKVAGMVLGQSNARAEDTARLWPEVKSS